MTSWSTVECWETALGLVTEGCILVSDLHTVLRVEVYCAEAEDAKAPWAGDLKAKDLLSPLHLMYVFKKLNLS